MGWKDWPYWLKGGVITFTIAFIINVIIYFMLARDIENRGSDAFAGTFVFGFSLYTGIGLVILGMLIGFIYGKLKR